MIAAAAAGFVIPPWVAAILWGAAAFLTVKGVGAWRLHRLAALVIRALVIVVAFELWLATSPRAEIQITGFNLVSASNPLIPHQVAANVVFKNRGHYAATIYEVHTVVVYGDARQAPSAATLQGQLRQMVSAGDALVEKLPNTRNESQVEPETDGQFTDVSLPLSDVERTQFFGQNGLVGIAGEFHYHDWWPFERVAVYCVFTTSQNDNTWTHCSNGR